MPEIWKNIKGYNGTYQVSNMGRVRRVNQKSRKVRLKKIMHNSNSRSYLVGLSKHGILKRFTLSRLVAASFIPHPPFENTVIHRDHNYKNNRASNLKWINSELARHHKKHQKRIQDNLRYWQHHYINGEKWRDIPLFNHSYQISNIGRVRSKNKYIFLHGAKSKYPTLHFGKLMYTSLHHGCPTVHFKVNHKENSYPIPRLVAKVFIPNPHHYKFVAHKDNNLKNNQVNNLYWTNKRLKK